MQKPDLAALLAAYDSAPYDLTKYAPQLEPLLRQRVFLLSTESEEPCLPLGSRVGGAPALPASAAWPVDAEGRPLNFLLQINLSELPELEASPLPAAGLLSFFIEDRYDTFQCFHFQHSAFFFPHGELQKLELREPPTAAYKRSAAEGDWQGIQPHGLQFELSWGLPDNSEEVEELMERIVGYVDEELFDKLGYAIELEINGGLEVGEAIGQFLGHLGTLGSDPREGIYATQNLLTLYESEDYLSDCRVSWLTFLISPNDLAAGDFSNLHTTVQRF